MNTANQFLGTERIGKLMGKYAVPCIISLLVGAFHSFQPFADSDLSSLL